MRYLFTSKNRSRLSLEPLLAFKLLWCIRFLHVLQKRSDYGQNMRLNIIFVWPMFGKNCFLLVREFEILAKGRRLVVEKQQQVMGVVRLWVMERKIDSWNWVGTMYGTESAMFHEMLIFKAGIDFVLGSSLLTSRESIPRRNLFSQGMDYVVSMPGVH